MFASEASPSNAEYSPFVTVNATAPVGWLPATLVPSLLQYVTYARFGGGGAIAMVGALV